MYYVRIAMAISLDDLKLTGISHDVIPTDVIYRRRLVSISRIRLTIRLHPGIVFPAVCAPVFG